MLHEFDKSSGEFHHIDWREVVARLAANSATNAGNGFDESHILFFYCFKANFNMIG